MRHAALVTFLAGVALAIWAGRAAASRGRAR